MNDLISSKEAFIELSEGRSFLWRSPKWSNSETWHDVLTGLSLSAEEIATSTHHREDTGTSQPIIFKKTPIIFKKEIEIPGTFKPAEGDKFYTLCNDRTSGYDSYIYYNNAACNNIILNCGAWRTEDEVKIVVNAMRDFYAGK